MLHTASPVAKTAFDAIQAKHSALVAAGYNPMVVENQDVYERLVEKISNAAVQGGSKLRRQTPLVNAGYAARVLSLSLAIHSFVSYHRLVRRTQHIQLLFVGCGMDVIGIWAHSLDPSLVKIVEIDTLEVCHVKRQILLEQGIVEHWKERTLPANDHDVAKCYHTGRIVPSDDLLSPSSEDCLTQLPRNYTILPIDLKATSALDAVLQDPSIAFEADIPTLTISELVLSYLTPLHTDHLLSWCATKLGAVPYSSFVALEPLGFQHDAEPEGSNIITVTDGYQRDYCEKFSEKMDRGLARHQPKDDSDAHSSTVASVTSSSFSPLGNSLESVTQRLRRAGFAYVSATDMGRAAAIAAATSSSKRLVCPEIFDEHAALTLHLQSYVLVSGFSASADDNLFQRFMWPWEWPNALKFARANLPFMDNDEGIVYTEIQVIDEGPVRNLFETTYKDYIGDYPAIRKMVKGVLNKDLRETRISNENGNIIDSSSSIAEYYRSTGGIFLVAIRYERNNENRSRNRCVIGCVGVRSCDAKDVPNGTMEVFRLAVNVKYRGRGVARKLLESVERYAQERRSSNLVANTLTILEAASKLYASCGYHAEKVVPLGNKLSMTTFVKKLQP
jgi:GNAT superfamily N-acetyltransferase/O-methyltransferase involved in polyketide biosynthesis